MHWTIEGYGSFESRQEGAGDKITTAQQRVTEASKAYQEHKVEKRIRLIYLQSIGPIPNASRKPDSSRAEKAGRNI
jgi:hypothetical protein